MVVVDDGEVYDDGTSAPPPPPTTNADILRKKPPARAPSPSPSPPPPPVKFDAMYYGLWPCENVGEHELEFSRGACIEVVNKDRYDSKGWWVGKLGGKVGLVPKDYMFPMYKQIWWDLIPYVNWPGFMCKNMWICFLCKCIWFYV